MTIERPDQNFVVLEGTVEEAEYKGTGDKRPFVVRMKTIDHGSQGKTYPEWHNVVGWGSRAEEMESIEAGDRIIAFGRIQHKKSNDRTYDSIYCQGFTNLTGKAPGPMTDDTAKSPDFDQDEIPF